MRLAKHIIPPQVIRLIRSFAILFVALAAFNHAAAFGKTSKRIVIYPAPAGEVLNKVYRISVNTLRVPVYNAKVGAADDTRRFKAVDDVLHSEDYYDTAAFAYFDLEGRASVKVAIGAIIRGVKILPSSSHIQYFIQANTMSFTVEKPQNITIEINGETVKSLHLFINPIDPNIPKANDPDVVFFGPGIHEVSTLVIGSNKTLYVAGGAILRAVIGKDEKFGVEPSGLKNYAPRIILSGSHIRLLGRGIIDAGLCPTHAGNFVLVNGDDIKLDGVIIRNSCGWTIPIRRSDNVVINNIKILGYRANSDGIDICNSRNVLIEGCFVRTNDDLIVVKTEFNEGKSNAVKVTGCVLWNPVAHALSIGAEIREDVSDVLFADCDVIHDVGREWTLRVFQSDSSTVSGVKFENIRIEEAHRLISLWIDKDASSFNKSLGHIREVTFKNITAKGKPLSIEMHGGDVNHTIDGTLFDNVALNGKGLENIDIEKNAYYHELSILPLY
jgi:hypothetical protein